MNERSTEPQQARQGLQSVWWDPVGLQARLERDWRRVEVRVVDETGSTNTDLLDLIRGDPSQAGVPRVLLAESQTAGRGRMGRHWQARPGSSLTFSIALALRPQHGWGALSLAVGWAVAQALQPWSAGQPTRGKGHLLLKWPNDLWWFDSPPSSPAERACGLKVAGILIETLPLPSTQPAAAHPALLPGSRWVVVGIGINVRVADLDSQALAAQGAAGTERWRPEDDAAALWHAVVPSVCRALDEFERDGFDPIRAAVQERELLVGQPVTLSAGPVAQGHCIGIDADGALLVHTSGGLQRVVAGEVQVRPALGPN